MLTVLAREAFVAHHPTTAFATKAKAISSKPAARCSFSPADPGLAPWDGPPVRALIASRRDRAALETSRGNQPY
jgi:hypothetical protein